MKFTRKYDFKMPDWITPRLKEKINGHDIYFDYSDDSTFYTNGKEEREEILHDIRELVKCDYSDSVKLLKEIINA